MPEHPYGSPWCRFSVQLIADDLPVSGLLGDLVPFCCRIVCRSTWSLCMLLLSRISSSLGGLPDLRARTANALCALHAPQRGSVTLLFHHHHGYLVKELKQKSSDCRHHSNTLSFLAPSSATAIASLPFTLPPFHPSVYLRLRHSTRRFSLLGQLSPQPPTLTWALDHQ